VGDFNHDGHLDIVTVMQTLITSTGATIGIEPSSERGTA